MKIKFLLVLLPLVMCPRPSYAAINGDLKACPLVLMDASAVAYQIGKLTETLNQKRDAYFETLMSEVKIFENTPTTWLDVRLPDSRVASVRRKANTQQGTTFASLDVKISGKAAGRIDQLSSHELLQREILALRQTGEVPSQAPDVLATQPRTPTSYSNLWDLDLFGVLEGLAQKFLANDEGGRRTHERLQGLRKEYLVASTQAYVSFFETSGLKSSLARLEEALQKSPDKFVEWGDSNSVSLERHATLGRVLRIYDGNETNYMSTRFTAQGGPVVIARKFGRRLRVFDSQRPDAVGPEELAAAESFFSRAIYVLRDRRVEELLAK